jgi:hypothetical protein
MKTQITISADSQFYKDLIDENKAISVNGGKMPRGYYNLILSIRDTGLYSKGIKPHRFWKITDVKKYFGLKGDAQSLHEQLKTIKDLITNK